MKISELKDREKVPEISLRIIWDKAKPEQKFGKTIKSVIVADLDDEKGPTAYLDIYNNDAEMLKIGDKIKITDAYSKLIQNNKGQFRITNAKKIELIEDK